MSMQEYLTELEKYPQGIFSCNMKTKCPSTQMKRMLKNKYIRRKEDINTKHKTYINFITPSGIDYIKNTKWLVI